jgi:hypothetical protein
MLYETNKPRFVTSYEIYAIVWFSVVFVLLVINCVNDIFVMEVITVHLPTSNALWRDWGILESVSTLMRHTELEGM